MLTGGLHLIIDGQTAVPLTVARVQRFLYHFPRLIGVRRITEPEVLSQKGGVCGIVIIAESHIAVHTRGTQVMADIFSCLGFDADQVLKAAKRLLGLVECRTRVIERLMPPPRAIETGLVEGRGGENDLQGKMDAVRTL